MEMMLDKMLIQVIFLFKFKMGHQAVETTRNINSAFGTGTASKHTMQSSFKKFCKGMRALKMGSTVASHHKLTMTNWEIIKSDALTTTWEVAQELSVGGRSQDGGGIGWGDHFLPYKFIERAIEPRANFTKELLIASWGHQEPGKAAHCLWKEVGQNIKDKKRDKRARDGDLSWEGSLNRGSFQTPGNPRTGRSGGSLRISEGNLTGREK